MDRVYCGLAVIGAHRQGSRKFGDVTQMVWCQRIFRPESCQDGPWMI